MPGFGSKFVVSDPDYERSPFTGMVRKHWVDLAVHLLSGVLRTIDDLNDPILLPRTNSISYPNASDPPYRFHAERFEGLARTLLAAAPLIAENGDLSIKGIDLKDYYRTQIVLASDPDSGLFLGRISDFSKKWGKRPYQHTCEGAILALCLMIAGDHLWQPMSVGERENVLALISDYAHERSIGQNWRLFNLMMLAFLRLNGKEIDQAAENDHIENILADYVGDGWYADDTTFDMYNPWAYHSWLPLWCHFYGREHHPEVAAIVAERNRCFMRTWPKFYGRNGHQLMWGRSLIYRFAGASSMALQYLINEPEIDASPGFLRRICSGNILQFVGREDFYVDGVPTLGYYGSFEPLVQFYSCAASPFWFNQVFAALLLPDLHPFWKNRESEGFWEALDDRSDETLISGPGIQLVNHGRSGTTEIKAGKVPHGDTYYAQLHFNTAFCCEKFAHDGPNSGMYSIREIRENGRDEVFRGPRRIIWGGVRENVLYRCLDMKRSDASQAHHGGVHTGGEWIDLAEITVPYGVLRIDRVRAAYANELLLAHYPLPHRYGKEALIRKFSVENKPVITASIDGLQIAMVILSGWNGLDVITRDSHHPEAETSTAIYASRVQSCDYAGFESLISVMLHRTDNREWEIDELIPMKSWQRIPFTEEGYPGATMINLHDGTTHRIDYRNIIGS